MSIRRSARTKRRRCCAISSRRGVNPPLLRSEIDRHRLVRHPHADALVETMCGGAALVALELHRTAAALTRNAHNRLHHLLADALAAQRAIDPHTLGLRDPRALIGQA